MPFPRPCPGPKTHRRDRQIRPNPPRKRSRPVRTIASGNAATHRQARGVRWGGPSPDPYSHPHPVRSLAHAPPSVAVQWGERNRSGLRCVPDSSNRCEGILREGGPARLEKDLIARVLAGDASAERELYDAHVDRVYRLSYRLGGGDADLAQDFTQETFLRAFDRLREFRGQSALSTWLHSIAVSVALNGMRKVRRWQERETGLEESLATTRSPRDAEPDLKARLREAVASLPERYRVVFVMYDVEGYTHEEIGALLGIAEGTSKSQLSRARQTLRAQLDPSSSAAVRRNP